MAITTGSLLFAMLKENCMTDVTFIVEGSEIRAHGVVAACRGGELKKVLQGEKKRAEINGITPQTFNTVLEYLYTAEVKVTDAKVFLLLHAAHELGLNCLQLECTKYLQKKLTAENFYAYATEAVNCGAQEFIKLIQGYFGQNTPALLGQEPGVFGCTQEVLRVLCGSEEINCSEVELFLFCMEWAKQKCREKEMEENTENLRQLLVDTLDNIRFSTMDLSDFQKTVMSMQILTFEEIGRIMMARETEKVRGPKYESAAARSEDADAKESEMTKGSDTKVSAVDPEKNLEKGVALKEYTHELFMSHTSELLDSEKFKKLSLNELVDLYTVEIIQCKELDLFIAAMQWYAINKPTEQDFHKVLNNIRFPTIPMKDFIEYVVPWHILTYEQIGRIIFQMQTKKKTSQYSEKRRGIWVHIEAYKWNANKEWQETRLVVKPSTTVGQLKALPIFNGGKDKCHPKSFTLGKKDTRAKLDDNVTLESIIPQSDNQQLELYFHSCSYVINGRIRSFTYDSSTDWHIVISRWIPAYYGLLKCIKFISNYSDTFISPGCDIEIK